MMVMVGVWWWLVVVVAVLMKILVLFYCCLFGVYSYQETEDDVSVPALLLISVISVKFDLSGSSDVAIKIFFAKFLLAFLLFFLVFPLLVSGVL